MIQNSLHH